MNQRSFLIGYDEEEIEAFLPSEMRNNMDISSFDESPESSSFNIGGKRL